MNTICTPQEAKQYSPLALAFLGDSVYEVMMREHLLLHANMPAGQLHAAKIQKVCAAYQAAAADRIQTIPKKKQPSTEEAAMQPGMPFPSMLPVPITERQPDWNVCLAICMS